MIKTKITELLGIEYPIIGAPMFLVSGPDLVAAVSNAGGLGTFASMSFRTLEDLRSTIKQICEKTSKPFGMNIVLHKAHNPLWHDHFQIALDHKIPLVITSMGTPRTLIKEAHSQGMKIFCDVIHSRQAAVVAKCGADGIIAVAQGAGGHAGNISPFSLIPQIKEAVSIPVMAAGSISRGDQMAAAFCLGADAVYIGTRFIATPEANASPEYKQALINADPEDIIYSDKISGVNANWIKESYDRWEQSSGQAHDIKLRRWIDIWSAGHGVAQIHDIQPVSKIIQDMVLEYKKVKNNLP